MTTGRAAGSRGIIKNRKLRAEEAISVTTDDNNVIYIYIYILFHINSLQPSEYSLGPDNTEHRFI